VSTAARWLTLNLAALPLVPGRPRVWLLRSAGVTIAPSAAILPGIRIISARTRFADQVHVGFGCYFEDLGGVEIGAETFLAAHCTFLTVTHEVGHAQRRAGPTRTAPTRVGRGCWLGARTTVLPGVTIGDGCVVAAGSVVTSDCEANGLYAGVPAVRKRDLPA
jgi:maltose O-acetyltransferase